MLKPTDLSEKDFLPVPRREDPRYKTDFYLGRLCVQLGFGNEEELSDGLEKTFKLCRQLSISIDEHFERVFFSRGPDIYSDWKISRLGLYLLIINAGANKEKEVVKVSAGFCDN